MTSERSSRAALVVAALSSFIGPFMSSSVNVALPVIGADFSMGAVLLGWVNTAFLLSAATFLIPFGRLGDLYGKKRIFVLGTLVLVISSALLALSTSATTTILFRVFQGFATSMTLATALPILISAVPPDRRGKSIGLTIASVYLGLSSGPFFGGLITQQIGWRYIFWFNVPLGTILFLIAAFMLPSDQREKERGKFDLAGAAILGASLLLTMYGFSSLPSYVAAGSIAAGLFGFVLFVSFETRSNNPLVNIALFRDNSVFAFSNLAALINYAATFAVAFLLSLYLQRVKGLSPRATGVILITQPIMQAIFSPLAGILSDKVEPRILSSLGMGITCVGLAMLILLTTASSTGFVVSCLVVLGFGFAFFSSPNTNAIMSSVDRNSYGLAGATVSAARQIGMMFSMGIVMMAMSLMIGKAEIHAGNFEQFLVSMKMAFSLFVLLCFGGIFASLARGRMHSNKSVPQAPEREISSID